MKNAYPRFLYYALNAFGVLSLALGVLYEILTLIASLSPTLSVDSGGLHSLELFGFGLISLGLGRVLKLLEGR